MDWARDQLPERPGDRGQTTGIILGGSDGSGERMVSGHAPESAVAGLILATSEHFPEHRLRDLATAGVATHVEVKLAVQQAESGVTHTVVVINNVMCDGPYGCTEAVAAILPRGFSMTVWEPGRTQPTIIEGKAT
ncbi:DddA-like double-stranded DNA deaminase toxin [Actinoalloteichus sp. AHMU CJ021]|uniref:DddA-like double-stranded DNA deaminase toxin n=1 Tax=Actinoalloteichus sp. AHMU CJ021 TaxID=2072503 RepID=UPI00307C137A